MGAEPRAEVASAAALGRLLALVGRRVDGPFGRVMDRHGLTRNAWWLLTELHAARSGAALPLSRWAERGRLPASSVTVAADFLHERGLVDRRRDDGNRRVVLAEITTAGVTAVDTIRAELAHAVDDIYRLYSAAERQILIDLLARLVDDTPGVGQH